MRAERQNMIKNHCINHKNRPPYFLSGDDNLCLECYFGNDEFVRRFGKQPEQFYNGIGYGEIKE